METRDHNFFQFYPKTCNFFQKPLDSSKPQIFPQSLLKFLIWGQIPQKWERWSNPAISIFDRSRSFLRVLSSVYHPVCWEPIFILSINAQTMHSTLVWLNFLFVVRSVPWSNSTVSWPYCDFNPCFKFPGCGVLWLGPCYLGSMAQRMGENCCVGCFLSGLWPMRSAFRERHGIQVFKTCFMFHDLLRSVVILRLW